MLVNNSNELEGEDPQTVSRTQTPCHCCCADAHVLLYTSTEVVITGSVALIHVILKEELL